MAESINQVVIELDNIKRDLKEFKKETRGKIEKVDERVDTIERDNVSLTARMTVIENNLQEIKDNTKWTKRALITALLSGAVTLLVSAVVFFATK